jgi:hypothetical protein
MAPGRGHVRVVGGERGQANEPRRAVAGLLVAPLGTRKGCSLLGAEALGVLTRKALVGAEQIAGERQPFEQLLGDLALGGVGGRRLEGDRGAVSGADRVEPQAPELARLRAAVAIAGETGELGTPGGRARLPAGHRGRVEQPDRVAERRRAQAR